VQLCARVLDQHDEVLDTRAPQHAPHQVPPRQGPQPLPRSCHRPRGYGDRGDHV
jgi:hypothetical protein